MTPRPDYATLRPFGDSTEVGRTSDVVSRLCARISYVQRVEHDAAVYRALCAPEVPTWCTHVGCGFEANLGFGRGVGADGEVDITVNVIPLGLGEHVPKVLRWD